MTDRNRNQDQPTREPQQSSQEPVRRDDDLNEVQRTESTERSRRERESVADDRGLDRDRRSFSGDRESDELGSEMEDGRTLDDTDDEFGESGGSER